MVNKGVEGGRGGERGEELDDLDLAYIVKVMTAFFTLSAHQKLIQWQQHCTIAESASFLHSQTCTPKHSYRFKCHEVQYFFYYYSISSK